MPPCRIILMIVLASWGTVALPDEGGAAGKTRRTDRTSLAPSDELAARMLGRRSESRRMTPGTGRPAGPLFFAVPAPLSEDFEGTLFPPAGWTILNPDSGSITWEYAPGVSGGGLGQGSAWIDFYDYEFDVGDVDELRTPVITGLAAGDSLFFNYAYAEYDDPFFGPDSLIVRISLNGGASFLLTLFADGGTSLATAPPTDLPYVPGAGEWRTIRTPLPPGVAGAQVVLSFTGVNGYSNNLYLDNIFAGSLPANDIAAEGAFAPLPGSKQRTSFTPGVIFRNRGTAIQTGVPVRCRISSPAGALLYDQQGTLPALAPGDADSVLFPLFALPAAPGTYTARFIVANPGDANPANDTVTVSFIRPAPLAGTITVGAGGDLPDLRAMADTLNAGDVVGPLTFRLVSTLFNEAGPVTIRNVDGSGPASPVLITPAPGLSVTVSAPGTLTEPYALAILGSPDILIGEPSSAEEAGTRMTITATGEDGAVGVWIGGTQGRSSSRCALRNVAVRTAADSMQSSNGFYGILILGYDPAQRDSGIVIERCDVTRHGQAGIAAQNTQGLIIDRSSVYGWKQRGGFTDLRGIWLASATAGTVVASTLVDGIMNGVNGWWAFGLQAGGGDGSALFCTNTGISRIRSEGAGTERNFAAGIWLSSGFNTGDRIFHASVALDGHDSSTFGFSRSSGIEIASGVSGFRVRNTIIRNATEHDGGGDVSRAFAVYHPAGSWSPTDTSNTNDLFVTGPQGAVGYFNGAVHPTLAAWRTATGQDQQSVSVEPQFAGPDNLHIASGTSPVANTGSPLPAVQMDIDGEPRDAVAPDPGIDEFAGNSITVPVVLGGGWNMVSNPVVRAPGTDSVLQLYPGALLPYAFNFSPVSGYSPEPVMTGGRGYWEKFGGAQTAYIGGGMRTTDTVAVQAGWNMIGTPSVSVDTALVVTVPPGLRSSLWFGYDGAYFSAGTLVPGAAYWVKSAGAGLFILGASPGARLGRR